MQIFERNTLSYVFCTFFRKSFYMSLWGLMKPQLNGPEWQIERKRGLRLKICFDLWFIIIHLFIYMAYSSSIHKKRPKMILKSKFKSVRKPQHFREFIAI